MKCHYVPGTSVACRKTNPAGSAASGNNAMPTPLIGANGWLEVSRYEDEGSASRFARKAREDWTRLVADVDADHLDVVLMWDTPEVPVNLKTGSDSCDGAGIIRFSFTSLPTVARMTCRMRGTGTRWRKTA